MQVKTISGKSVLIDLDNNVAEVPEANLGPDRFTGPSKPAEAFKKREVPSKYFSVASHTIKIGNTHVWIDNSAAKAINDAQTTRREAKQVAKDAFLSGLNDLRKARRAAKSQYMRSTADISRGVSHTVPEEDANELVQTLTEQYPTAALYLKAESYMDAANIDKYAAGEKAIELIRGGDVERAKDTLKNWNQADIFSS